MLSSIVYYFVFTTKGVLYLNYLISKFISVIYQLELSSSYSITGSQTKLKQLQTTGRPLSPILDILHVKVRDFSARIFKIFK
jgi:hypothetical protein